MDERRFDALTRLFATVASRRRGTGILLAALAAPLSPAPDAGARRRNAEARKRKRKKRGTAAPGQCCNRQDCALGKGKNLGRCCFEDRDLTAGNFKGANLGNANFARADLTGANFTGANLDRACFVDANTTGARFGNANRGTAIFCRTETSSGFDNSGCNRGTPCCPTCDAAHPCGRGEVCCDGRCIPGDCCDNGEQSTCGAGQICCDGRCLSGDCCTDRQCQNPTPVCADNRCAACQSNGQCGAGRVCCDGSCLQGACCENEPCSGSEICCGGECRFGNCCSDAQCPPNQPHCQFNLCAECWTPQHCGGDGHVCCNNRCFDGDCCSDVQCRNPTPICQGRQCVSCPTNGASCIVPGTTDPGLCCNGSCLFIQCCTNAQCTDPDKPICIDRRCAACTDDGQCGSGEVCCEGRCEAGNCCTDAQCANPTPICANHTCVACQNDGQCDAGEVCCSGQCRVGDCCTDAQCANPTPICQGNDCVACQNDRQCGDDEVCCNGSCFGGDCCRDQDCPSALCQVGVCRDHVCAFAPVSGEPGPNCPFPRMCCQDEQGAPVCCAPGTRSCQRSGICGCLRNADCPVGEVCCAGHQCERGICCQDSDCLPRTCQESHCQDHDCSYTPVFAQPAPPHCPTMCCRTLDGAPVCCPSGTRGCEGNGVCGCPNCPCVGTPNQFCSIFGTPCCPGMVCTPIGIQFPFITECQYPCETHQQCIDVFGPRYFCRKGADCAFIEKCCQFGIGATNVGWPRDGEQFDALARLVWARTSRRSTFGAIAGVALLGHAFVPVAARDMQGHSARVLSRLGRLFSGFGSNEKGGFEFDGPSGIAVDPRGNIDGADTEKNQVKQFPPA